ncbi:geranylgeranyl pyrophosphate synthase [Colletotrichum tofieldiae]|nr:geranylgeranyl pyrophosphate synthase [Colletotrichum tofieldiae]
MKKYISKCLLEALEIDRPRALRMINSYRSKWLDVMERNDANEIENLDEYLVFRNLNGGMEIVNAVHLFMRTEGLAIYQAKEAVRDRILAYEAEFLSLKAEFYKQNPNIAVGLKKYIETCGVITAGNHYWCANCPRHHSWRSEDISSIKRSLSLSSEESIPDDCTLSPAPTTSSSVSHKSSPTTDLTTSKAIGFITPDDDDKKPRKLSDSALQGPCRYIRAMPSKGLRHLFAEALGQWLLVDDASLDQIKNIIDLLHNSSLILDDIEDDSPIRRGFPATHMVFGRAQSINSANFMFVQAVQVVRTLNNPDCLELLLEELECLFVGQSWDLHWKFHTQIPTEQEYFEMVDSKTGAMFRLLTRLMLHTSSLTVTNNSAQSLDTMCRLFGRFFQVRDDFMNLSSNEYSNLKGFCEDLDEGKISYPMVLALRQSPEYRNQIMGILRQQTTNTAKGSLAQPMRLPRETKVYILGLLKSSGAMVTTLKKLQELETAVESLIDDLEIDFGETNPVMRILLSRLSVKDATPW